MKSDMEYSDLSLRHLFKRITHLYFSVIFSQITDLNIHPGQLPMIKLLSEHQGLTQREIADKLHIRPPTVTVALKRMEKAGLVEKRPDAKDQRKVRIYLSEKGNNLNTNAAQKLNCMEEKLIEGFTANEISFMKVCVLKLIENIEKIEKNS